MDSLQPALLALEDGTLWPGLGFGARGDAVGEIVFNTSMTGYQEILTDPSYCGQLVTMTTPHIGNTGVTDEDQESDRIWAEALIVRDLSCVVSNWRAQGSLPEYLQSRGIPALTGVETRALVRHIRTEGAMQAALSTSDPDAERLLSMAHAAPEMSGRDLAREVTCQTPYAWQSAQDWWRPGRAAGPVRPQRALEVIAYDYGVKHSILNLLTARGCRVTVVPASFPASEVLSRDPDGIFLSNGPGDPAAVDYAIANVRALLGKKPIFGICLGHQILALALGGKTNKLKFGHRGGNQPVQPDQGTVQISAHNHGFAVKAQSLPTGVHVTHVNLNDGCCEGLAAPALRAFSVQYHPESSPGPHDSAALFDRFVALMAGNGAKEAHAQAD